MGFYDIYNPSTVGDFIRVNRENLSMSQQELADELNVTISTISKWEIGENTPKLTNLAYLSKIFGISIDKFFELNQIKTEKFDFKLVLNNETKNLEHYMNEYINLYNYVLNEISNFSYFKENKIDLELLNKYYSVLDLRFDIIIDKIMIKIDDMFDIKKFEYYDDVFGLSNIITDCKVLLTKYNELELNNIQEYFRKKYNKSFLTDSKVCKDKNGNRAKIYFLDINEIITFTDIIHFKEQLLLISDDIFDFTDYIFCKNKFSLDVIIENKISNECLYKYFSILPISDIEDYLKLILINKDTKRIYDLLIYIYGKKRFTSEMYRKGGM